ncbi:guanine nucleotide-binding protein g(o) subunit alpha [Anaeramoeba flamelloides]|uniref:Guanine nucleotide-binding protein g(O) subunit alpha n=1 Tax=Anaeramoeba flamelloides TaxID=1746091 RepID=A0AAV8A9T7_9EUKA|nr:guanine nucleotide-binding protein g(o) subunit alpha [Anaeramoeba flamelloides]
MGKNESKIKRKRLSKQSKRSKRIDQMIAQEQDEQNKEVKILLLGTGDSGKSTVVKQIQILYKGGFKKEQLERYKNILRSNLKIYIKSLIRGCEKLNIPISDKNETIAQDFVQNVKKSSSEITEQLSQDIQTLWADPGLKKAYENREAFQLPDAANYFLDRVDAICKEDFIPTEKDILHCRIATVGVKELHFEVNGHLWRIVDVGGQRSERRKWLHQFDDVSVLIFVVAMNEYNMCLYEDERINRMDESRKVFGKTVNNGFFKKKDLVLLLNKTDLFEEKIKKVPLSDHFSSYKGSTDTEAKEFIKKLYLSKAKKKKRQVYSHCVCATNTDLVSFQHTSKLLY